MVRLATVIGPFFSKKIVQLATVLFVAAGLGACGQSYDDEIIKEYRLTVTNGTAEHSKIFRALIAEYNRDAGFEALRWVDSAEQANSAIIVTKGLQQRDGKVGWGQWLSETEHDKDFTIVPGERIDRTITYSMRLEFDQDYIETRSASTDPARLNDVKKLFTHEVGHGLMLGHANTPADVMYYDISGDKDFDSHFEYVRTFFGKEP